MSTTPRETLYVTHPRSKVHIRACPHLSETSTLVEATPEQVEANGLCSHCEKEVHGTGRRYVADLEEALRLFGHRSDDALARIRTALDGVAFDTVWLPHSESYVALAADGVACAWVGKGYVEVKGGAFTELPWFRAGGGGGPEREEAHGGVCPVHFVETSLSGECDLCA